MRWKCDVRQGNARVLGWVVLFVGTRADWKQGDAAQQPMASVWVGEAVPVTSANVRRPAGRESCREGETGWHQKGGTRGWTGDVGQQQLKPTDTGYTNTAGMCVRLY